MSVRSLFMRRDPFWEADGPAARRARRRRRASAALALAAALTAVGAAAFAWFVELGFAATFGIPVRLPLG